jgi:hypothetical protein
MSDTDKLILSLYLVLAGVGGIALLAPDVVAWGSFLVIPFLVLFPAATLLIYASVACFAWFVIGPDRPTARLLGVAVSVALVGFGIPALLNAMVDQEERALRANDLMPVVPFRPDGAIAFVQEPGRFSSPRLQDNSCNLQCRAILLSGSAPAVIMAQSMPGTVEISAPQKWTVQQQDYQCVPPKSYRQSIAGLSITDSLEGRIKDRLLIGECPMGSPALLSGASLIVQQTYPPANYSWTWRYFGPVPPEWDERIIVWRQTADGKLHRVAQQTIVRPRRFNSFFYLDLGGSPNSGAHWELARVSASLANGGPRLDQLINLKMTNVRQLTPGQTRGALDRWLARRDYHAPFGSDRIVNRYFRMLRDNEVQPDDLNRVIRLIYDPRIQDLRSFHLVANKFVSHAAQLREEIGHRVAGMPPERRAHAFESVLKALAEASNNNNS